MSCLQRTIITHQGSVEHTGDTEDIRRVRQVARSLAHDIVMYRLGKANPPPTRAAAILRKLSDDLEDRHAAVLANMCGRLNVLSGSAHTKFVQVADEVFRDGVNWGRIVAIFAFGAKLAQYCMAHGLEEDIDNIIDWVGNYISSLSGWISTHGGWESFNQIFGEACEERDKAWWRKLCLAAVGVGAIATLVYQQSC